MIEKAWIINSGHTFLSKVNSPVVLSHTNSSLNISIYIYKKMKKCQIAVFLELNRTHSYTSDQVLMEYLLLRKRENIFWSI